MKGPSWWWALFALLLLLYLIAANWPGPPLNLAPARMDPLAPATTTSHVSYGDRG